MSCDTGAAGSWYHHPTDHPGLLTIKFKIAVRSTAEFFTSGRPSSDPGSTLGHIIDGRYVEDIPDCNAITRRRKLALNLIRKLEKKVVKDLKAGRRIVTVEFNEIETVFNDALWKDKLQILKAIQKCQKYGHFSLSDNKFAQIWISWGQKCQERQKLFNEWLKTTDGHTSNDKIPDILLKILPWARCKSTRLKIYSLLLAHSNLREELSPDSAATLSKHIVEVTSSNHDWHTYLIELTMKIWDSESLEILLEEFAYNKALVVETTNAVAKHCSELDPETIVKSILKLKSRQSWHSLDIILRDQHCLPILCSSQVLHAAQGLNPQVYEFLLRYERLEMNKDEKAELYKNCQKVTEAVRNKQYSLYILNILRQPTNEYESLLQLAKILKMLVRTISDDIHRASVDVEWGSKILVATSWFAGHRLYPHEEIALEIAKFSEMLANGSHTVYQCGSETMAAERVFIISLVNISETACMACKIDNILRIVRTNAKTNFSHALLLKPSPHLLAIHFCDEFLARNAPDLECYDNEDLIECFIHLLLDCAYMLKISECQRRLSYFFCHVPKRAQRLISSMLNRLYNTRAVLRDCRTSQRISLDINDVLITALNCLSVDFLGSLNSSELRNVESLIEKYFVMISPKSDLDTENGF